MMVSSLKNWNEFISTYYVDVTVSMVNEVVIVDEAEASVQICAVLFALENTERNITLRLATSDDLGKSTFQNGSSWKNELHFAAVMGLDYTTTSSDVLFNSGSRTNDTRCINVAILEDSALELDEVFDVTLTTLDPSVILTSRVTTIAIRDNES